MHQRSCVSARGASLAEKILIATSPFLSESFKIKNEFFRRPFAKDHIIIFHSKPSRMKIVLKNSRSGETLDFECDGSW